MRPVMLAAALAAAGCAAATGRRSDAMNRSDERPEIAIELLALDLESCGRCTRTSRNLDEALEQVAGALRATGAGVTVRRTVVRDAEEARQLRFLSSPTIRVNGKDIALELRESRCGDCGAACGGAAGVDCRVWVWRGEEHVEAPKAMIVDAILRAYGEAVPSAAVARPAPAEYALPENLRRVFAGKGAAPCCSPAEAKAPAGSCGCGR